jgi:hypothetical protein
MLSKFLVGLVCSMAGLQANAQTCSAQSPAHAVALVELYTSEGCSSCPPADRWLQAQAGKAPTFDRFVPLSLHVNYWDYIGWKDPFAQQSFTTRQREYARLRGSSTVYTPQVVLAGKDFPAWDTAAFGRALAEKGKTQAAARVQFTASAAAGSIRVSGAVQSPDASRDLQLHFVVFEMGLRSKVTRGENSGTVLTHDFVARQWHGPILAKNGRWSSDATIVLDAAKANAISNNVGLAAFVQTAKGEVLQATACLLRV